jgi:exosome complex component RRP40
MFSEEYKVDIRSSCPAILPVLAFENATKRNRPFLKVGDLVFARVVSSHIDMEPEISCVDSNGKAAGYGPLGGGYMFETGSRHVLKLRSRPPPPEIVKLPSTLKWESALGANGRVWVHSSTPQETSAIVQILQDCARIVDTDDVDAVINRHRLFLAMNVTK